MGSWDITLYEVVESRLCPLLNGRIEGTRLAAVGRAVETTCA